MKKSSIKKKLILVFLLNLYFLKSQNISISPYSIYGLGEKINGDASFHGMGGISTAYEHPFASELNLSNPAANSKISHTIFKIGLSSYLGRSSQTSSWKSNFYFSELSLGFPIISKKVIFGASYVPYYGFFNKGNPVEPLSKNSSQIDGKGNTNLLSSFLNYKLNESFSLGLMGRYLYGNVKNSTQNHSNHFYSQEEFISSLIFRFGLLYKKTINHENKKIFQAGAFYDVGTFNKFESSIYKNTFLDSTSEEKKEFLEPQRNLFKKLNSSFYFPPSASLGISYEKEGRWMLSSQLDWEKTSNFNSIKRLNENYKNSYKAAIGGYFIPQDYFFNYLSKIIYRAGIYYENKGIEIKKNPTHEYGLNFGLGLPLKKELLNSLYIPYLNISVGINKRKSGKIFNETYAIIKMGISFGEKWFGKKVYD